LALPVDNMVMRRPPKSYGNGGAKPWKTIAKREHGASKLILASAAERIVYRKPLFKAGEQRTIDVESLSMSLGR
jgi:hypothetical protein